MPEAGVKRGRGRPRKDPSEPATSTAQALDRGLHLLALLADIGRGTLSEVAEAAELAPSTTHRLLTTMQRHGVVELDDDSQHWMVGIETFRIGSVYLKRTNLVEAARETLRGLMEETGETANLGIADDGDVVFVSQVETHNPIRAFFRPGTRGPMHASGIGKALLAEFTKVQVEQIAQNRGLPGFTAKTLTNPTVLFEDLATTRARGWALDDEERHVGMRCIAAPIFNVHAEAVAGVSVSGPTVRLVEEALAQTGATVRRAALAITREIGGRAPVR